VSQQINLFNPIFLKQKKYFAAVTMVQALGVILLGCLLLTGYAELQVKSRTQQAADSTALLAKTKAQLITVSTQFAPRQSNPALDVEIKKTESSVQSLQRVFDALQSGEFGDTRGYSSYFRSFARQIVDGLWLTGVHINGAGNQIDLKGRTLHAELVPEYLRRLGREADMKSKTFSTLDMQVPMVDAPADPDGKVSKPPVPANYIEFDLESIEVHRDAADNKDGPRDASQVISDWTAK
jgi:Tfp pilus assembly protein PilN